MESPLTSPFAREEGLALRSSVQETLTFNSDFTEQSLAISKGFSISLSLMDWVVLIKGVPRAFHYLFQGYLFYRQEWSRSETKPRICDINTKRQQHVTGTFIQQVCACRRKDTKWKKIMNVESTSKN